MSSKKSRKNKHFTATLVTENRAACAFCNQNVDDEITYGKQYAIGDIQCHYFCALLSCCLIQKGKDNEGLFGFLYDDILAEIERSKKHKCSHCREGGATLGCAVRECRRQFHLPCGRGRGAVSLFYGTFKSFCRDHAPKQRIPDHIMVNVRARQKYARELSKRASMQNGTMEIKDPEAPPETVCAICYETVLGSPSPETFWPPCCARDAWFHRTCLQRMALTAGLHYLKCPLCNDREQFHEAVVGQGYYVPDRDAAWELEQNAFAEIYERPLTCSAEQCACPSGREHDDDKGPWDIRLCILCGTTGIHIECYTKSDSNKNETENSNNLLPTSETEDTNESSSNPVSTVSNDTQSVSESGVTSDASEKSVSSDKSDITRFVCSVCKPAAPKDLESLAATLDKLIEAEQSRRRNRRSGPVMPSRMSLRRTKPVHEPSTSQSNVQPRKEIAVQDTEKNKIKSRTELNLKTPKRQSKTQTNQGKDVSSAILKNIENKLLSPLKVLEDSLHENIKCMGVSEIDMHLQNVIDRVRDKFKKPRPLREKQKILNDILESVFNDSCTKDAPKAKDPLRKWSSPKKMTCSDGDGGQNAAVKTKNNEENIFEGIILKKQNPDESVNEEKNAEEITKTHEEVKNVINNEENVTEISIKDFAIDNTENEDLTVQETSKLKTVDIEKDSSLEISENDDVINIDVLKIKSGDTSKSDLMDFDAGSPPVIEKCSIKFSPVNKEFLKIYNIEVDLESFKNHYLNEIDRSNSVNVDNCLFNVKENISDDNDNHCHDNNDTINDNDTQHIESKNNIENEVTEKSLNVNLDSKKTVYENNKDTACKQGKTSKNGKRKKYILRLKVKNDTKNKIDENIQNKTEIVNDDKNSVVNANIKDFSHTQDNKDEHNTNNDSKKLSKKEKSVVKKRIRGNKTKKHSKHARSSKNKHKSKHNSVKHIKTGNKDDSMKRTHKNNEQNKKAVKRKLKSDDEIPTKKMKFKKYVLKYIKDGTLDLVHTKRGHKDSNTDSKIKKHKQISKFKIRFRKEKQKNNVKVQIKEQTDTKNLKQCILSFNPEVTSFITKPENDVSPPKRKYSKQEKSSDHLKQTSIASFFKIKVVDT